jgi:hypothetical protein
VRYLRLILFLVSLSFAQANLQQTLSDVCKFLYDIVGSIAFLMILLASIVHTLGQMFPAEIRARANVYSWNLVVGAFIGVLILILVPWLIGELTGLTFNPNNCTFT